MMGRSQTNIFTSHRKIWQIIHKLSSHLLIWNSVIIVCSQFCRLLANTAEFQIRMGNRDDLEQFPYFIIKTYLVTPHEDHNIMFSLKNTGKPNYLWIFPVIQVYLKLWSYTKKERLAPCFVFFS